MHTFLVIDRFIFSNSAVLFLEQSFFAPFGFDTYMGASYRVVTVVENY